MIKIVKGDLLNVGYGIIGHQVNAQGKMGSGVALQVKNKYPKAYKEYMKLVNEYQVAEDIRGDLLGRVQGVEVGHDLFIANMFGQYNYGYDGKQYTNPESLFDCFKTVRKVAEQADLPVALPYKIGCFRGGADWNTVEDYLLTAFEGYEVTIYKYHEG